MCIIVTKERGAEPLPTEVFNNCWDHNPDGAGILYFDGQQSVLKKGLMKKADFMEAVKEVNKKENSFIVHTRIATHGSVKPSNTHPFISETLGFAHNGTMPVKPLEDKTDSESFFLWTIAEKSFKWCQKNKFLLDLATHGSRCVIFDMETGELLHLCENDWEEDKRYPGAMFSNKTYSYPSYKTYLPTTNYYGSSYYDDEWYDEWVNQKNEESYKNEKKDKEALLKIESDALKTNKEGLIIGQHDWVKMTLEAYAEKGGYQKAVLLEKIKEMEQDLYSAKGSLGKYHMMTNAISVMKQYYLVAYQSGFWDAKSVYEAYKEFVLSIYPDNPETTQFVEELQDVGKDYK